VEQAAQAVKDYGYDGIEWRLADGEVITPKTAPEIKARLLAATKNEGLKVACLDTSCTFVRATDEERKQTVEEAKAMIDLAAELGTPYIRVFGGKIPENFTREEILEPSGKALGEAARYGQTKGVTVLLETHDDWAASPDNLALIHAAGAEAPVQVLWDVHHPYRMGETPVETINNLLNGGVIAHIHIKDALRDPSEPNGWHLTLLEEGEVPVKEIVGLLHEAGYEGYLSLEWEKKWHPDIEEPEEALPEYATLLRRYIKEAEEAGEIAG
jgi:sugar phosphate isomerase/epimerase